MHTALCLATSSSVSTVLTARGVTALLATGCEHPEPGEALLDRFEPSAPYFSRSASAAEIASARGFGRLAYDAV